MERGISSSVGSFGAEFAGKIGARNDAHVDFVAELSKYTVRSPPDTVSACFVDARAHSNIRFDAVRQLDQFLPFELEREIAGIGVLIGDLLDQRRIVPGLQVSADFARPGAMQITKKLVCFGCAADGVIEHEGRPHGISLEDPQRPILTSDRGDADCPPGPGRLPVEFGFGIDDNHQHWPLLGRPVDHPPGIRVEHSSTIRLCSLWPRRLRPFRLRTVKASGGNAGVSKKLCDRNRAITRDLNYGTYRETPHVANLQNDT